MLERVRFGLLPGFVVLWALILAGCGGVTTNIEGDGGRRKDAGASGNGSTDAIGDHDGPPIYVDDVCIDAGRLPPILACDPFAPAPCSPGKGCYPVPPRASGSCDPGTYSTVCELEGNGGQDAPCNDTTECVGSFVCVKSGLGNRCARLCKVATFDSCPDGFVCRVLDLAGSGWGGCG